VSRGWDSLVGEGAEEGGRNEGEEAFEGEGRGGFGGWFRKGAGRG